MPQYGAGTAPPIFDETVSQADCGWIQKPAGLGLGYWLAINNDRIYIGGNLVMWQLSSCKVHPG